MKVKITMFSDFKLKCYNDAEENGTEVRLSGLGKELQNLIQLLIVNRTKHMQKDALTDVLYADRKDPAGCLKYAIFRLRAAMKEQGGLDLVVTDSAGYILNPEYEYEIDTEQYEEYCAKYRNAESDSVRAEVYDKITALYSGYFYQTPSQVMWTIERREFYHNQFCTISVMEGEDCCLKEDFKRAVAICSKVLSIDEFCENASYVMLKALIGDRQYVRATNYYKNLTKLYMDNFGEPPSQKLRKMVRLMTTESTGDMITVDNVQQTLANETVQEGAFFCNYDIFAYIFQHESRKMIRDVSELVHLLIIIEVANAVNEEASRAWMAHLKESIRLTLRKGDAFTQANKKQFLVMSLCHELGDAEIIAKRIEKTFYNSPKYSRAKLNTSVTEILPFNEIK